MDDSMKLTYTTEPNSIHTICHNHKFSRPSGFESHSRKKHIEKVLPEKEYEKLVKDMRSSGMRPAQIRDVLHTVHKVRVDIKDVCNLIAKLERHSDGLSDSARFLNRLHSMKQVEGGIFFTKHDEEGRLQNVFWSNREMLQSLRSFGEVLIMDTTNKRNRYGMPLFFCVCIDGNGTSRLCAAALLFDETGDTWVWVLECLKRAIDGHVVISSFFTDSDLAIISVIPEVFPEVSQCRNCLLDLSDYPLPRLGTSSVSFIFF